MVEEKEKSLTQKLAGFFGSLFCVYLIMFYLIPAVCNLEYVKPLIDYNIEHDIDAAALYYTEIKESSEADLFMNNTMDYAPKPF